MSYRGAISIACRLVDPLREMVKIPPASLGVGMYQHDLKEAILTRRLGEVLEEIVSECGVDVNMASEEVENRYELMYVLYVHPITYFHRVLLNCCSDALLCVWTSAEQSQSNHNSS